MIYSYNKAEFFLYVVIKQSRAGLKIFIWGTLIQECVSEKMIKSMNESA